MSTPFLSFDDVTLKIGEEVAFPRTTWCIETGETWGIVGANGSGKSLLVEAIQGRLRPWRGAIRHHFISGLPGAEDVAFGVFPRGTLAVVSTANLQRLASGQSTYMQARWHGSEGDDALDVTDFLSRQRVLARHPFEVLDDVESEPAYAARRAAFLDRFCMTHLARRKVMQLSNGELRKLLFVRALLLRPRFLILDEPFAGLDAEFRVSLRDIIRQLILEGVAVLFITARPDELPEETTHVLVTENRRVVFAGPRNDAPGLGVPTAPSDSPRAQAAVPSEVTVCSELTHATTLVALRNVTVRYGETTVLDGVHFTMLGDESWAILGPNGSGKSTLLSLVLADNPQAYANDVTLFDRRRGTGESIWDIKAKIGCMGADLHALYPLGTKCLDVVGSGWSHSMGFFDRRDVDHVSRAKERLAEFGLAGKAEVPLGALADGEQRLVLLARALVHRPLLLVLDEPCQGLDASHRSLVMRAIDDVAAVQSRVIFVTHHHDEIPRSITHVLRLRRGQVEDAGPRQRNA